MKFAKSSFLSRQCIGMHKLVNLKKIQSNFNITCIKEVKLNQFHHKFKNYMNLCKLKIMEFPIYVSKPHVRTYL